MASFALIENKTGKLIKKGELVKQTMLTGDGRLVQIEPFCKWRDGLSWECDIKVIDVSDKYSPCMKVGCG